MRYVDDDAFFAWCTDHDVAPIGIQISTPLTLLPGYSFPTRSALIVGNEGRGMPRNVLARYHAVVTIPQHGPVACLNSAVAGVIAMYEAVRSNAPSRQIVGDEYVVEVHESEAIRLPAFGAAGRLVRS